MNKGTILNKMSIIKNKLAMKAGEVNNKGSSNKQKGGYKNDF